MRNKGFTVIEAIWAIAILGTMITMYQVFNTKLYTIRKAKNLAELTQFYAKTYGQYLNDMEESSLYAMTDATNCARINPFITNDTNYYTIGQKDLTEPIFAKVVGKQSAFFTCKAQGGNYWNDTLTGMNEYKQVPCIAARRLEDGTLQALLYWANTTSSIKVPTLILRSSVMYMDGAGAYFESNGTSKGSPNFSVNINDPLFNSQYSSCSGKIGPNSVVFDISGYIPSNNHIIKSYKLGREKDFDHDPNTPKNKNTAQSNIYLNGKQIILDEQNTIQAQDDKVVFSGRVVNSNPMPLESVDSYTACDESEIGTIMKQRDEKLRQYGAMQIGNEVCTKAPAICKSYQGNANVDNCYLPTKTNTIKYSDMDHTGKLGQTALCPDLLPVLRSATVWQPDPGSKPTKQYRYTQSGGFNIVRGLTAVKDPNYACNKWQFNARPSNGWMPGQYGSYCLLKPMQTYTCSVGTSVHILNCPNGSSKPGWIDIPCDGKANSPQLANPNSWKCLEAGNNAYIETMICSSKYYVEQQ